MIAIAARRALVVAAQELAKVSAPDPEHFQAMLTAVSDVYASYTGDKCTCELVFDGRTALPAAAPALTEPGIVQDVADVFRGCGFEVRDELGTQHQFAVSGSLDSAAILLETVMTGQKIGGVERFHWTRKGMELDPNGFYIHYRASDDIGRIDGRTASTAAPEGWKLVPVEPTMAMIAALGWEGDEMLAIGHGLISQGIANQYKAALAAAPSPLSGTEDAN